MLEQQPLFDLPPTEAELHYLGLPDFRQRDLEPKQTVMVHFRDDEDRRAFAELVGQTITPLTQSIWYPKAEIGHYADRRFVTKEQVNPRYPVYIISKGRWESRLTSKALEASNIPYSIVIEPQEYDNYAAVIDPSKILVLPFSNLGQGSIPARNWVWEHSLEQGAPWHWILDDNINGFFRLYNNLKTPVKTGATFRAIEDFADRYDNLAITGMNYFMFASRKVKLPPLYLNTRVYSCILIRNDIPYRWRGRYNEDTDLCLRALKDGWCTVLFNAFLAAKEATLTMKGGNTDELYKGNGRLLMAQSLQEQHPDLVKITTKWGRPQHHVNYKVFKQKLIPREGMSLEEENNYGMELEIDEADNG